LSQLKLFLPSFLHLERYSRFGNRKLRRGQDRLGPLYPQTYEGSFVADVGNVMTSSKVDKCILTGERLKHIPISQYTFKVVGL
jgi:hypothetical protein